ncbi:hypothetical protein [Kitasatospora sp. NPDC057015]|uniref:hypothetical protein n=1 Tax=Kitasatospora sp. NPDC057015 TaxID=3346001 RepID=UPI00362FCF25
MATASAPSIGTPTAAASGGPVPGVPASPASPAAPTASGAPSVHRRALITWLAVYPAITLALAVLGPALAGLPLVLRTLVLTAVVVPVAAYLLIPGLLRLNAGLGRTLARRRTRG